MKGSIPAFVLLQRGRATGGAELEECFGALGGGGMLQRGRATGGAEFDLL